MPAKAVAVEGDVTATAGTAPFTGAESGTWTAGAVSVTTYDDLVVGTRKVVWKATCTFSFTGASSSGAAVSGAETVTLTASTTLLNQSRTSVLVDGDAQTGGDAAPTFDNRLSVAASGALRTG
jgi:hypothetical protein